MNKNLENSLSIYLNSNRCRICLLSENEVSDEMLNVCNCRGTSGLVHLNCLETWIRIRDRTKCEICSQSYRVIRRPTYTKLSSIPAFISENAFYKWVFLYLIFATTATVILIIHIFNHRNSTWDYTILAFTVFIFFALSVLSSAFKDWSKWNREQYQIIPIPK